MRKNQYKSDKNTLFSLKEIQQSDVVIGVDEAGRGAWAGPVVAACVAWSGRNPLKNMLRDSKKMTAEDREITYGEIFDLAQEGKLFLGIGVIDSTTIDTLGIKEANRLAMFEALQAMKNEEGSMKNRGISVIIDGRDNYTFDIPGLPEPHYIVRGDSKIKQIMAASILAKVTRDKIMIEYEDIFPGYGFARHKGYGTAFHKEKINKFGICYIHRKSYAPIKLATSRKGL